jgi:hypothetical protein
MYITRQMKESACGDDRQCKRDQCKETEPNKIKSELQW